jgi:hypothetical protein
LIIKKLAVDAVYIEPLSSEIPVNREKYREFPDFGQAPR